MPKFRKKPVVIEAVQFHPDRQPWPRGVVFDKEKSKTGFFIETLEGHGEVTPGDWIITGVKGERYSCKDDIFKATYESAEKSAEPVFTLLPPWTVFDRKDGTADVLPSGRPGAVLERMPLWLAQAITGPANLHRQRY